MLRLGDIPIEVVHVRGVSESRSWQYAEHATIESLPVLQRVAPNGAEIPLSIKLHRGLGDPDALYASLLAAGDAGEVFALQTDAGALLGHFVMTSLERRWSWSLPDGTLMAAGVELKLREHRAPTAEARSTPAVEGEASPSGEVEPTPVDSSGDPGEVPLSEAVRV